MSYDPHPDNAMHDFGVVIAVLAVATVTTFGALAWVICSLAS